MNKMKDVAKLLGLELGEYFKIKGVKKKIYKLGTRGIYTTDDKNEKVIRVPSEIIIDLLMDTDKVIKLPWFPKDGEDYFVPSFITSNDTLSSLYRKGFVCKTNDESDDLFKNIIIFARKYRGFTD